MSTSAEILLDPPAALQALPPLAAVQKFRDALVATGNDSLETILSNLEKALTQPGTTRKLVLRDFAQRYAKFYFDCDVRLAEQAFALALDIRDHPMLLWGALRDIASPVAKSNDSFYTGVDPNAEIRALLDMQPAAFEAYFGSADYVTCPEARSIFSPGAYLVDLLRLINAHFVTASTRSLEARRPDIYSLALSPENTFGTITYIQLVIEVLSSIIVQNYVRRFGSAQNVPSAFEIISTKTFPFTVPFNYPLEQTRANLGKIGFDLASIAKTLRMTDPLNQLPDPQKHLRELQEMLRMSPEEWDLLTTEELDEERLKVLYGREKSTKGLVEDLSDVELFMKQTKLSRDELQELVHQDLSDAEFNIGLSRMFFINDVTDNKGYLTIILQGNEFGIAESTDDTQANSAELIERFQILTLKKLDRIHKFVRLARKLQWSFTDLDWALRATIADNDQNASTSSREQCLYFDGINDVVAVKSAPEGFYSIPSSVTSRALTVEGWVLPRPKRNRENGKDAVLISSYDSSPNLVQPSWSVVLTSDSRLRVSVLTNEAEGTRKEVTSLDALETGKYAHFSIRVSLNLDGLVLNGYPVVVEVEDREYNLPTDPSPGTTSQGKSALLLFGSGPLGEEFHGCLQEIRIWKGSRDPAVIRDSIYERLSGYEDALIGYWPMREVIAGKTMDLSLQGHGGLIGGSNYACMPKWMPSRLNLEEPRQLRGLTFGTSEHGNSLSSPDFFIGGNDNPWKSFQIGFWVRFSERAGLDEEVIVLLGADSLPDVAVPDNENDNLVVIRRSESNFVEVAMRKSLHLSSSTALKLRKLYYVLIKVESTSVQIDIRGETSSRIIHQIPAPLSPNSRLKGCVVAGGRFAGTLQDLKIWTGVGANQKQPLFDATSAQGKLILDTSHLRAFWPLASISSSVDSTRISRDASGNDFHLRLAKLASNFSPVPKEPLVPVSLPATVLAMDGKSAVQITNSNNMGLGRMLEGTFAFWFKPLPLPTAKSQLLFAHGEDDVGITAYLDRNTSIVVTAWSRIYDAKRRQFVRTETVKLISLEQGHLVTQDEWHMFAIVFAQDLEAGNFDITVIVDNSSTPVQNSVKVSLSPTEPINLGGLPERSNGWIAFEDKTLHGNHMDIRPEVYFSGLIMDVRLWNTKLNALTVKTLMSRAPEMGTENSLLLSAPLDSIRDSENGENVLMIAEQWQKPGASCSPGEFAVTLYRQKNVVINNGNDPYGSEYLIYTVTEANDWKDYAIRGRMKCSSDSDGAGVVFYSSLQTTTDGSEYRDGFTLLGKLLPDNTRSFELMRMPSGRQTVKHLPGASRLVLPGAGWYRFLVESNRTDAGIEITAKVWMQENAEPEDTHIVLVAEQHALGTVGLWSLGAGEKKYDDLMIYKDQLWQPLFAEGFEEAQVGRANNWLDIHTHLTPFAPLEPSLRNQCLGFDTYTQESENVAIYLGQPEFLRSWTKNQSTKIRGRMMFETDGGEIGLYLGLGKTDGNNSNSLALVRAPFRGTGNRNRVLIRNAFVYRLEARNGLRVEILELSDVIPLHSRWYHFEIEIVSSGQVGAKIWEEGTTEPNSSMVTAFPNWRRRDNTCLGLMGRLAGRKFYSDIDVTTVDSTGASMVSSVPMSAADDHWDGDLTGFGIVQPQNALVGAGVGEGRPLLSLYRSELDDEIRRWENPNGSQRYSFCGRVFLSNGDNSFAIIVNCRVPFGENRFYSIQRTKETPFIHGVEGYGDSVQLVESVNSSVPLVDAGWYKFKVFVTSSKEKADVKARVWMADLAEPAENNIEFSDSSPNFLSTGTVGVWSDSAQTLFDSLTLNEYDGFDVLINGTSKWPQYIAARVPRFLGSIWRMEKTNEDLFQFSTVGATPEVRVTGDRMRRFFSFTEIPRVDSASGSLLIRAQIWFEETEAEAGITFSSGSNRSPRYAILIRSGAESQGSNGMLQITGFDRNGEKLRDRGSFVALNATTSRHTSNLEIAAGVRYNLLIQVGDTKSVEGDMTTRMIAKVWRVNDVEPTHFAVVGYTNASFEPNELGLYGAGSGDKSFLLSDISTSTDIVKSGNRVWQGFGWVNAYSASLRNSLFQSFHVKECPDDSLLWLRKEDDSPNRAQKSHLDFSGKEQFITAKLPTQSWTFRAVVTPRAALDRGQRSMQPVITVSNMMFTVWIGSGSHSTVNVQVGRERMEQSYSPQEWPSLIVTVFKSAESVTIDFHDIARYTIPLTNMEPPFGSPTSDLYVGRSEMDELGGEKLVYYNGQMSRLLLLSRAISIVELDNLLSLTHSSVVSREHGRGSLQASWPSVRPSKQFTFGGPVERREPQALTEILRSVALERSAWASEAFGLVFDSQFVSISKALTVPFNNPNPATTDLRSRTVQVMFRVKDSTRGSQEQPQLLYREGQIQLAIAGGKLYYVVGYDSLSKAIKSDPDSVPRIDLASNQWYAAALTLEAGKYARPGAVMVYLDGSAVSVAGGSLLSEHAGQECLLGGGYFEGTILSVQVLADVASVDDIAAFAENPRLSPGNALVSLSNTSFLAFQDMAKVEQLSVFRREPSSFESIDMPKRLENIAYLADLMKIHDLDVSRAISLIGPMKEVGRKDGKTPLFDLVFNQGFPEDVWSSQMNPVPWSASGQSISDVIAKIRLVRASGFPITKFDDLLEYLGTPTAINGYFLQNLANASGLTKLFGIEPKLLSNFLEVMGAQTTKIGIRNILSISLRLKWFQSRDISIDLLLQLLGLDETVTVSAENINEMVQLVAADVDNFRINVESLQSDQLSVMEVELLLEKLVDVNSGIVSPETGLLTNGYLYEASLESMRLEKSWTDILLRSWLKLFQDDFWANILDRGLQDNMNEFGSLSILVKRLISIGLLFGPALHEELSSDQLLLALQGSEVEGPALEKTAEVIAVLDTLVENVVPVWAEKVESVEKKLLERRSLMDGTVVNGIADLFELNAGTISRVFQIPDFVTVENIVSDLLKHPDEALSNIAKILQVARIADAFDMSDDELDAYVEGSSVRSHVFGVIPDDTLSTLSINSVTGLSAYRDIREYIENEYEEVGRSGTGSGTKALVALLRQPPSFDQGDVIAKTFSWDRPSTERTLHELSETLGYASTDRVDVLSLWYVMRVFKLSTDLSLELRQVKLFASTTSLSWKAFEDLSTLSTGSLRSLNSEDTENLEDEIFAEIAPPTRDALLGVIESNFDDDDNVESDRKISSNSVSLAISDFILLDVQTAPAVLISRVQQAIQSTQLFINKALLREEDDHFLSDDHVSSEESREFVKRQWDTWMRNYRVWEAARKVFLYPENFIEPELRSGSSPEFQQLVDRVSGGGDSDSISAAVSEYVRTIGHVLAGLRIAGAGYYHDENDENSDVVERLMVVGRTAGSPGDTFVRQRVTTRIISHEPVHCEDETGTNSSEETEKSPQRQEFVSSWGAWQKVEQAISSPWISPCYAFGTMHLFWVEWLQDNSQYYVLRDDYVADLTAIEDTTVEDSARDKMNDAESKKAVANRKIDIARRLLKSIPNDSEEASDLRRDIEDQQKIVRDMEKKSSDATKVLDSYTFYKSLLEDPDPDTIEQAKKQVQNADQSIEEIRFVQKDLMDKEMSSKNGNEELKNFWGKDKFLERENRPSFVSIPVLTPTIKYVQQRENGSWTTPQSYPQDERSTPKLLGDVKLKDSDQMILGDHRKSGWQRLYCMRAAVQQNDIEVRSEKVMNTYVWDAARSTQNVRIPEVEGVATFELLAKIGPLNDFREWKPFERSLKFLDAEFVGGSAEKKEALTDLGFFGPPQGNLSISLASVSRGESSLGIFAVETLAELEPNGIQGAYSVIDEVLTSADDDAELRQIDFEKALQTLTGEETVQGNDKAKTALEHRFGRHAKFILSVLEKGPNSTEMDLLTTSEILKRKATLKSLRFGLRYYDGHPDSNRAFKELPSALLGKWSHYVFLLKPRDPSTVTITARPLQEPKAESEWSFVRSESLDESDTITMGYTEFSVERNQRLLCDISEARAWDDRAPDLFSTEWEGLRITDLDITNAKNLGLLNHDGLYNLQSPNLRSRNGRTRRGAIRLKKVEDLELVQTVGKSEDFSRERVIAIHNGNVYSIENSSSQAYPVRAPTAAIPSENIALVMEPESETSNNSAATVYAVNRSSIPPLSPKNSPESLDFYSGSRAFEINPETITGLHKKITTAGSNTNMKIALLGGSRLKWNAATVQPVQNMMGGFIVETGDEVILVTANARSKPDNEETATKAATKTVSELLLLEQGANGENSWTLTQIPDPNPPHIQGFIDFEDRFAVERVSAPALHSVVERFAKGGPPTLFSESTQTETESPANGPDDKFSNKFLLSELSSKEYLEFVRIGAESEVSKRNDDKPLFFDTIDFMGSNSTYYWELFFHVPMLIADSLNANSQYAESRRWFGYVFDPNGPDAANPWKFVPFRRLHTSAPNRDPFVDILGDKQAVREFRQRPFDAHLIASTRNFAYQKSVFMKYVSNLLDEGDSLFIDDRESINESLLSYFLAAKVLGSRPREIPRTRRIRDTTFRAIMEACSKLLKSFVIPSQQKTGNNDVIDSTALTISFCVPENERLLTLWNRVEDRLYKIRNSLDINGTFRQLDLFAPPIDPAALVAAFAAGNSARDAILQLNRSVPSHRFNYMLEAAISSVEVTMKLGSQLLSALENLDSESLSILAADQLRRTTGITEIVASSKVVAARHQRQALDVTYRKIDNEVTRYEGLLDKGKDYTSRYVGIAGKITGGVNSVIVGTAKGKVDEKLKAKADAKDKERIDRQDKLVKIYLKEKETASQKVSAQSTTNRQRAFSLDSGKAARKNANLGRQAAVVGAQIGNEAAAAGAGAAPDLESGVSGLGGFFTSKIGGEQFARVLEYVALVLETTTTAIDIATAIMELNKDQALTKAGWERSLLAAKMDRLEVDERLAAAIANEEAAVNEESLAISEALNAEQTYLYHQQKFSNADLYLWLSNRLKRTYRNSYQLALQTAKEAERALQFELPTDRTFINGTSWSSARNGLLAAEILRVDLQRMRAFKTEQSSRFLEIERKISMRNELPRAWRALLDEGECAFEFSEQLFDRDFPGQYFRVLKTVAVTIVTGRDAIFERENSLRGKLEQLKNRVVMTPKVETVEYLMNLSGATRPNTTDLRSNWRANQAVVLSKWTEDTGMFVVDYFRDERYFPFEGTGAVSSWRLSIPGTNNMALAGAENVPGLPAMDRNGTDIIFTVKYSARSEGVFAKSVQEALARKEEEASGA